MLWAPSKRRAAYISQRVVGVADAAGEWLWGDVGGWIDGLQRVMEILEKDGSQAKKVDLWLSGSLARPFIVEPVPGLKSRDERILVAERTAADLVGFSGPCEVWLQEPASPGLAVAVEQELLSKLRLAEAASNVRFASIRPWWSHALRDVMETAPSSEALLTYEPDSWTLLSGSHGTFQCAETVAPAPAEEDGAEWLRRTAFAAAISGRKGKRVQLIRATSSVTVGAPSGLVEELTL